MSKCKQCGFELEPDVRYCPNCAKKVDIPSPPAGITGGFTGTISGNATVFAPDQANLSTDLEAGKEFHARYTIERKLGQGGMGVVYLACDKLTARRVALKLINPLLVNSASARERFLREGLISRDIRHKNVVAVYDVSEAEGQFYLVMEYLSGETLRSWLHRIIQAGGDVLYPVAEMIIQNILEGLDAAHTAGVVHRDVKPENIMLTGNPESGDYNLKILDFGIARAVDSAAVITTTTSTGTALYMAPEQRTAADTVGPPADLYAVTAIFYELLLGVATGGRWAPLSTQRKDLPAGIDAVIDKGLSNYPRSRYQNAQEYLRALHEIRNTPQPSPEPKPVVPPVKPVPPVQPAPAPRARSKKRWIAIGAAVFFGLWLIGAYFGDKVEPTNPSNPEPPSDIKTMLPPQTPSPQTPPSEETKPPIIQSDANLQGTWYDELEGTGIAQFRIILVQNGEVVTGIMYDTNGFQWGTISGRVSGNVFDYNYYSRFENGSGQGQMSPDGDMDVVVNGGQRHVMHRNHLPG
jgi:serine/threonine protein kinase